MTTDEGYQIPINRAENFFIPSSYSEYGFDERMMVLDNIFVEEFDLLLFLPGMTYSDIENMTGMERKRFHKRLGDYLEEKRKAQEQSFKQ